MIIYVNFYDERSVHSCLIAINIKYFIISWGCKHNKKKIMCEKYYFSKFKTYIISQRHITRLMHDILIPYAFEILW